MNVIQVTKPVGRKWNILLDAVVEILKCKKIRIYHAIYIKVLYDGTVSYFTVSTDGVLNNNNNNKTTFPGLRKFLEEAF